MRTLKIRRPPGAVDIATAEILGLTFQAALTAGFSPVEMTKPPPPYSRAPSPPNSKKWNPDVMDLSLIHISEPTRLALI
eukprot:10238952-Alexandrium_andersonii.AAC.1